MLSAPLLVLRCVLDATVIPAPAAPVVTAPADVVTDPADSPPPLTPGRRALAVGAALVPGALLHGSGHFAAGDRKGARRLLATEGVGVGLLAAGLGGLAFTGASRRVVAPLIWLTGAGFGTFALSAVADLYGVLAPRGTGWGAAAPVSATDVHLTGLHVRNPTFGYRFVAGAGFEQWLGRVRLAPSVFGGLGGEVLRAELRTGYRLHGPVLGDGRPALDYVDASLGLFHHRQRRDPGGFDMTVGDLFVGGRFGLGPFLASLTGAFVEWGAGAALGGTHYPVASTTEVNESLLMRFGFGAFFTPFSGAGPGSELMLIYDHRHDGFAGGMKMSGLGSGAAGQFGLEGRVFLTPRWGLGAAFTAGSAHVFALSLRWRPRT